MQPAFDLDLSLQKIRALPAASRPLLIAIDGFGGAGKTSLAEALAAKLGSAYVVHLDDFIVKNKLVENDWDKGSFDRRRLAQQVLKPAGKGLPVSYQKLIWETGTLSQPEVVPQVTYLIIEGISATHPDVADYYDFSIWVAADPLVAKRRGQLRDAGNENVQHWDLWSANDQLYLERYQPQKRADITIQN